ncbi:MAG: tRNA adenosine(34) deaminase TadA [Candidatus Zixiibacteriota bacterium]
MEQGLNQDQYWMQAALKEAEKALKKKEVPVGAVVVYQNKIIGRGHNQVETLKDATAHAEILAIGAASNFLGSWRLSDASIYVTVEPCIMCAGAIILSRLDKLIFGAFDPKAGACGSLYNLPQDIRLNHQVEITSRVLEEQCKGVIQTFFEQLRKSEGIKEEDERKYEKT